MKILTTCVKTPSTTKSRKLPQPIRAHAGAAALGAQHAAPRLARAHGLDLDALAARVGVGVDVEQKAARRALPRENPCPALGVARDLRAHARGHRALPQRAAQALELDNGDAVGRVHDEIDAVVPDDFVAAEDGDRDLDAGRFVQVEQSYIFYRIKEHQTRDMIVEKTHLVLHVVCMPTTALCNCVF